MKVRVGFGYDVHQLVEGRDLILGGIKIEHCKGLLGHSDADVLLHAVCDALLGAASMRDIGYHFPDTKRLQGREYRRYDLCRTSKAEPLCTGNEGLYGTNYRL